MRQMIKRTLDAFFKKTMSYRLVHEQMMVDSDFDVWKALKVSGFSPRTIIDVGAAVGSWTCQTLKVFPTAQYLMVDPLTENEPSLMSVTKRHKNVQYWMGALGRSSGELEFHVHGDQSSMYNSNWGREGTLRRVRKSTMDELVTERRFDAVDGIKLDVQGAELEVLAGSLETLRRCQVVQIEVMFRHVYEGAPLAHDIVRFFAEHNFRIYDIASLYKRKDRALLQGDFIFVREDALFAPETWNV